RQHFVEARLFDIQDLALERQNRLEHAVASHLRGAAGGIALDQEDLALARIAALAVGELAGQRRAVERRLAARQLARLARRLARTRRRQRLLDDAARHRRILLEELSEPGRHDRLDEAFDLGIAELGLGLALELRLRQFDADDRRQALAYVF